MAARPFSGNTQAITRQCLGNLSRPNIAITIKMLLAVLVSQLFNHQNMRK
jgi:hypothetical protein